MVRTKELDQFSNAAWSVGVRRESVIAPLAKRSRATQAEIERAATKLGLGTAMVFRLVARYRRERNTSVLAPERPGRKRGSHVLGLKLERIIQYSIGNFYLRPEKPSVAALHCEFVHHLNDTSFRVPRFIYQLPKAHPWLGQFPISTRLGLVSHLAALFGGAAIRQQLFTDPTVPYALLAGGLKSLVPSDAKQFNQKMATWPDEHKSLVFGPNYTH